MYEDACMHAPTRKLLLISSHITNPAANILKSEVVHCFGCIHEHSVKVLCSQDRYKKVLDGLGLKGWVYRAYIGSV